MRNYGQVCSLLWRHFRNSETQVEFLEAPNVSNNRHLCFCMFDKFSNLTQNPSIYQIYAVRKRRSTYLEALNLSDVRSGQLWPVILRIFIGLFIQVTFLVPSSSPPYHFQRYPPSVTGPHSGFGDPGARRKSEGSLRSPPSESGTCWYLQNVTKVKLSKIGVGLHLQTHASLKNSK